MSCSDDFIDDDRAILTFSLGAGATVPATPVWSATPVLSLWVVPPSSAEPSARHALVGVLSADEDDLRAVHHLEEIVDDETPRRLFQRLIAQWSKKPRTAPKAAALQRILDEPRHWSSAAATPARERSAVSIVLRAASASFDVDHFLAAHPELEAEAVWHEGTSMRPGSKSATTSGFNACLADDDHRLALAQALAALEGLRPALHTLKTLGVVVGIDIGVFVEDGFSTNLQLSTNDLRLLADLGVDLELSMYPCAS